MTELEAARVHALRTEHAKQPACTDLNFLLDLIRKQENTITGNLPIIRVPLPPRAPGMSEPTH